MSIKNERKNFKSQIDDYFTIEPDTVLNDINLKLNNTIYSIKQYNEHFNKFSISSDLTDFLNKYGDNSIKPKFEQFNIVVNDATKNKIISTVEKNSENYINNFNLEEFNVQSNNIFSNIKEEYIESIKNAINEYGIETYPNNLENK